MILNVKRDPDGEHRDTAVSETEKMAPHLKKYNNGI
jgi:hypothetical protein